MNSWLILTVYLSGYILFKIHINEESSEMEKIFGEEYLNYRKITPEFFPNSFRKESSKKNDNK